MLTLVRLSVFTLAHGMKPQPANYGNLCLRSIANVRSPTLTFGQRMQPFYRASGIKRWAKRQAKPATEERFNNTLRQRVSRLVRKPCPFPNPWRITSVPFGISSITTMHHYLCSTTKTFYTDGWGAYARLLDENQHVVGKSNTQKIERKHLTLRTRIKRLARKTICFSKSEWLHDIVIGLFINRYEFGRAVWLIDPHV